MAIVILSLSLHDCEELTANSDALHSNISPSKTKARAQFPASEVQKHSVKYVCTVMKTITELKAIHLSQSLYLTEESKEPITQTF